MTRKLSCNVFHKRDLGRVSKIASQSFARKQKNQLEFRRANLSGKLANLSPKLNF